MVKGGGVATIMFPAFAMDVDIEDRGDGAESDIRHSEGAQALAAADGDSLLVESEVGDDNAHGE